MRNAEQRREYKRQHRIANPEKTRERDRLYRTTHPEKIKESRRKWYATNREKSSEWNRRRYLANRERAWDRNRKWMAAHPGKAKEYSIIAGLRKYGLTLNDYDAMLKAQGGGCAGCKQKPRGRRLAVDHDHATGHVRGLLCTRCNHTAGRYKDSSEELRGLLRYLEKHSQLRLSPR